MSHLLPPRRRPFLGLAVILLLSVPLVLAWNHVLPGGGWLRSLFRDQRAWDEHRHQAYRAKRIQLFEQEVAAGAREPSVIWIGSSTVEYFPIAGHFPKTPSRNRGIGGELLSDMRDRLHRGWPEGEVPLVVFYGGSADLRRVVMDPREIAREFRTTLKKLKDHAKSARILAIEVLSARESASEDSGPRFQLFRELQASVCEEENVPLVRTYRPPLILPDGRLSPAMSRDRYHLNNDGYRVLAGWIAEAADGLLE